MRRIEVKSPQYGAPVRFFREKLAGRRRPIWRACWAFVCVMVAWDVYLAADGVDDNTWSEVLRTVSMRHPVFPWMLGVILAHLFHHRDDLEPVFDDEDAAAGALVVLTLLLVGVGFVRVVIEGWMLTAVAAAGMFAGYLCWPKYRRGEWHW